MKGRALIIVDLQKGFLNRHTRHIRAPIERFQNGFDHVIATQYYRRPDAAMVKLLNIDGYEKGSPEAALAFRPREGALVLEKTNYSCVDAELLRRLQAWGWTKSLSAA